MQYKKREREGGEGEDIPLVTILANAVNQSVFAALVLLLLLLLLLLLVLGLVLLVQAAVDHFSSSHTRNA